MRILLSLFVFLLLAPYSLAGENNPLGSFKIINSGGFLERNGKREILTEDFETRDIELAKTGAGDLLLTINETDIALYEIENGLASLTWNAGKSGLLHHKDILDLSGYSAAEDVPAWGANVFWPGLGQVQLVLLPLGTNAYTGFLISHPGNNTVVRQMELRSVDGPPNRPVDVIEPASPAIN